MMIGLTSQHTPQFDMFETKDREKQQYILSKIQMLQITKQKERQELITGLPSWSNNFDNIR
jgi:hypothetical protein